MKQIKSTSVHQIILKQKKKLNNKSKLIHSLNIFKTNKIVK